MQLRYKETIEIVADILTKPIRRNAFQRIVPSVGIEIMVPVEATDQRGVLM